MSTATTLAKAAGMTFDNLQVKWLTGFLSITTQFFGQQVVALFPESNMNARPVANWGTILRSVASQIPSGIPPVTDLNNAAQIIYRLCWMGSQLQTQGLITTAEATSLLVDYNSTVGF